MTSLFGETSPRWSRNGLKRHHSKITSDTSKTWSIPHQSSPIHAAYHFRKVINSKLPACKLFPFISPISSPNFRQQFWSRPYCDKNKGRCYFEVKIIPDSDLKNLINKMTISYFYLRLLLTSWYEMIFFHYHNHPRIVCRFSEHNKSFSFLF